MKIRIDLNLEDHDIAMAIACMEIGGYKKINSRSIREYLKGYLKDNAYDSLYLQDRNYRDPSFKFYEAYMEAKEKLKDIK